MDVTIGSPLLSTALLLLDRAASADELEARFAEVGARLDPGVARGLLAALVALGLARPDGGRPSDPRYHLTSVGREAAAASLSGDVTRTLSELERLRTDLLATIAHELRTPLTVIRTSSGLLLEPTAHPSEEQRRRLLDSIRRSAERMQRLVDDLLDVARSRSGTLDLQLRRFDAVALARTAMAGVETLAQDRGQILRLTAPAEPIAVYGDRRRLEQALLNLLSNAQRYSPDGGSIEVDVRADGDRVRWGVTDHGPGIRAADRARLFQRFFVGTGDSSARGDGVGLGLPTALAFARSHGGSIEVVSEPGEGSTFTLVVPVDGPPGAE